MKTSDVADTAIEAAPKKLPPIILVKALEAIRDVFDRTRKKAFPASLALCEIVTSHWLSQALIVAARLNIAEELRHASASTADLAQRLSVHEDALYRLLRTLASVGIFKEESPRVFALNKLARPLLQDHPDSIRSFCLLQGREFHWQAWGGLDSAVQSGQSSIEQKHGKGLFDYLAANAEDDRVFNEAMTGWAKQSAYAVAQAHNFSKYDLIADIGGGHGYFLRTILRMHKNTRGILFDQPHIVESARSGLERNDLTHRCTLIGGSFFDAVPRGADAYILKNILHDWNDEQSLRILRSCRNGMQAQSRLLIVESVVPRDNSFHVGKLIDLEMLVCTPGGRERTLDEFETLLDAADLRLLRIHPTAAVESVLEIAPV